MRTIAAGIAGACLMSSPLAAQGQGKAAPGAAPATTPGAAKAPTPASTPAPSPAPAAAAGASAPMHVITYVELPATAAVQGVQLLKAYRDALRKAGTSQNVEIYQEGGRRGRFAIRTGWLDVKAFEAHAKDPIKAKFDADLEAARQAPPDQRLHDAYSVGPVAVSGASAGGPGAVIVLTHVDVPPPLLAELEPLLKQLADASRKEPGSIRFDVLQQTSRKNHFTMAETWQTSKAHYVHEAAQPARLFRDKLGPMLGALYDQRIYSVIR